MFRFLGCLTIALVIAGLGTFAYVALKGPWTRDVNGATQPSYQVATGIILLVASLGVGVFWLVGPMEDAKA